MAQLQRETVLGPGCITRLKRVLDRIERERDHDFLARAITLLWGHGHEVAAELLLAQAGVAMLLRERKHVRRILRELRCRSESCGRIGLYVDTDVLPAAYYCERHRSVDSEALGLTEELLALEEIESAEDGAAETA